MLIDVITLSLDYTFVYIIEGVHKNTIVNKIYPKDAKCDFDWLVV